MVIISDSGIVANTEKQKMWLEEMKRGYVLYFSGYPGIGKTAQAEFLAEKYYTITKSIKLHNSSFLEEYRQWKQSTDAQTERKLLILDHMTYLKDTKAINAVKEIIDEASADGSLDLILIGRAMSPAWLRSYHQEGRIRRYQAEYFLLDREEMAELVYYELERVAKCFSKKPEKWLELRLEEMERVFEEKVPMALVYYLRCIKESGGETLDMKEKTAHYLWEYVKKELKEHFREEEILCMYRAAMMRQFDDAMINEVLKEKVDVFYQMLDNISYISKDENGLYHVTDFFREFACEQLEKNQTELYEQTMERIAACYVERKRFAEALELYRKSGNKKKLSRLLVSLTARCDGTEIPKICYPYLNEFSEEDEEKYPAILYVKVILHALFLHPKKSNKCLMRLRKIAEAEKALNLYGEGRKNYIQALLGLPYHKNITYQNITQIYMEVRLNEDEDYESRMQPTGGGPSVINGGMDLMKWVFDQQEVYTYMKNIVSYLMGPQGEALSDIILGEYYLETNERLKAIGLLVSGMSDLKKKEHFREYYAVNAMIARSFVEDNRLEPAMDIAQKLVEQVTEGEYPELYGNVCATYMEFAVYEGVSDELQKWLEYEWSQGVGNFVNKDFSVADRYRLYVMAKVCMSLERYAAVALILSQLIVYAEKYERKYFLARLLILNAILAEQSGESGKEDMIRAVELAFARRYIRVIADEGAALLPLWKKTDWNEVAKRQENPELFLEYITQVGREMKKMAGYYPHYMQKKHSASILSKSEKQVLDLIYNGKTNEKIAEELMVSISTVKFHVSNILRKLNVKNRNQAVKRARELGEID